MSASEEKTQELGDLESTSIRFSIRFNYVLFPFNTADLINILIQSGFTPTTAPPPQATRGVRFAVTGTIARKGEVLIDVNDDRGVLAVTAPSAASAISEFNELLQLIRTNFKVDLEKFAFFYELIGHTAVRTDRNPLERMGTIFEKNETMKKLGQVLGENVSLFTLKLASSGQMPSQTEWFDLTVEPDIIKASTYNVSTVFRSHDKSRVQKFTEGLIPKILELIHFIEGPKNQALTRDES